MPLRSYLDLIDECDNFSYANDRYKSYYALRIAKLPDLDLGYLLPSVAQAFNSLPEWDVNDDKRLLLLKEGDTEAERSKIIAETAETLRQTGKYSVLSGWRNELYPVFGPDRELLFSLERAASPLFGIMTYGCHMTAYVRAGDSIKIWVPRRAKHKQTYGGMLDNTVAGGLATGETALGCIAREAEEEASLPEAIVRKNTRPAGAITYFHVRDQRAGGETGLLQPECEYVYDLELPEDVIPKPCDNEVESFELKTIEEVQAAMKNREFKPNCALVLLDFFVRHGILTPDEPGYLEIIARTHRKMDLPLM